MRVASTACPVDRRRWRGAQCYIVGAMLFPEQSNRSNMEFKMFIWCVLVLCAVGCVSCLPLQIHTPVSGKEVEVSEVPVTRSLWKRFIDSSSSFGGASRPRLGNMRTRRSLEEQCERLRLCRLHARAGSSFLAAFQLYFVNRENARLWDHRARSPADCERRFSCDR